MAKTTNSSTPAQGGGGADQNQNNLLSGLERSELTEARNEALKDSQSVDPNAPNYVAPQQDSTELPAILLTAETPEWVQTIIESNQAVVDSNHKVIDALEELKSFADERSNAPQKSNEAKSLQIDEDEDYIVAPGKSFRDPADFTKEYSEGDDVTHLDNAVLNRLLNQGLIEEA